MISETRTQRVVYLSQDECLTLLASVEHGRIAYDDAHGPVVIPVNHVMDHGTIVVRTSAASALASNLRDGWMSYQADDLNRRGVASWSVLVRGRVEPLEPDAVGALPSIPMPQAEGIRTLYLRITPHLVTGRQLMPSV